MSELILEVQESDLEAKDAASLNALQRGDRALGGNEQQELKQRLLDALPRAIARRLRGMLPDGFELAELEMSFSLSGAPFGVGVGGEVKACFKPRADKSG